VNSKVPAPNPGAGTLAAIIVTSTSIPSPGWNRVGGPSTMQ